MSDVSDIALSIIIPNYNYAGYVEAAIRSAVDQAGADIEIFVVDDGSTDRSWEKIERYSRFADCVRLTNGGPLRAVLHAFERARGRYVMVLDADDRLEPGAIDEVRRLISTGCALVQSPLRVVGPDDTPKGFVFPDLRAPITREQAIAAIEATGTYLSPPTSGLVFRRDVFEIAREIDYEVFVDGVTYLAAPWFGDIVRAGRPLSAYRVHDRNVSAFHEVRVEVLAEERARFIARLEHLEGIARRMGRPIALARRPDGYAYVKERDMLIARFGGRHISLRSYLDLLLGVLREKSLKRVMTFGAYLAAIVLLPDRLAEPLAIRRRQHWKGYGVL